MIPGRRSSDHRDVLAGLSLLAGFATVAVLGWFLIIGFLAVSAAWFMHVMRFWGPS